MSHQSVGARLNEKKASVPSPSPPVQSSSGICIKQEYFEDHLPVTVKTETESAPNEHNIMQSIKVEVKEEHYDDQDCVVKCELDFDEGEQMDRMIKVEVEDDSRGQLVQLGECVKKEEVDGGEYVMECDCEECETCRVKMEMKEELDESGFETELGGNSGLAIEGGTRVKKEEEDGEVEGERPKKIQRMDRVVVNVPVGSLSPSSNVMSINVEYVDDQVASTSSTNPITIEDLTQPSQPVTVPHPTSIVTPTQPSSSSTQHVNEDGGQSLETRQDTSAAGGQQVLAEIFVKRIEPADELGNRFECDYQQCGRRMKLRTNLIRHIRSHTGEKPFKCTVNGCDSAFVQKGDLKSHLNVHSGNRPFVCIWAGCEDRFGNKTNLTVHLRTHTGEKPFKCTVNGCDRAFVQKGHLDEHLNVHSGTRSFVCTWPGCEARFAKKGNLTVHTRTHTGERPFECDLCDDTFTQHAHLVTHLRTHTGARPFVCTFPDCGQAFIRSDHLKTHSIVHSSERQFSCDARGCTKVYKRKDVLLRHQKDKHN